MASFHEAIPGGSEYEGEPLYDAANETVLGTKLVLKDGVVYRIHETSIFQQVVNYYVRYRQGQPSIGYWEESYRGLFKELNFDEIFERFAVEEPDKLQGLLANNDRRVEEQNAQLMGTGNQPFALPNDNIRLMRHMQSKEEIAAREIDDSAAFDSIATIARSLNPDFDLEYAFVGSNRDAA
jgi:hypothetical protein